MADTDNLAADVQSLKVNGDASSATDYQNGTEMFGFSIEELYKLALKFYKEKEGKALHLAYKDKMNLVALTKQVTYGKHRADVTPDVGFLDVVGNNRRQAWQSLGDMAKETAMTEFVNLLNNICPQFKPFVDAHKAEKDEQDRLMKEEEERAKRDEEERQRQEEEAMKLQEIERQKQAQQEIQIRAALNQQTAIQFKQYAEQQYPGNAEQQEVLIKQLQEQHFQQYMQQVYQQQLLHQQQQYQQLQAMAATSTSPQKMAPTPAVPGTDGQTVSFTSETPEGGDITQEVPPEGQGLINGGLNVEQEDDEEGGEDKNDIPPIAAPSMWTRKDIKEYKESIRKDSDSIIKVGSGETVTVRVPTHEDGTCLFWEFATDSYDIGFGVYFEWTVAPSNQVSVHVSESSDEEDLEDEEGGGGGEEGKQGDVEKGSKKVDNRPPTDEIIPVYRRDCHEEVYCGSHVYPGRGVYLLKFDNSYSLWRSKTLYYRVYYTR